MKLAKAGLPTIFALAFMTVGAYCVASLAAGVVMLFPLGAALWFYRDPERVPPDEPGVWVSPADGKVVEVVEGALDEYAGACVKVGIFMNGFDVHVNRAPAAGEIEYTRYVPGKKWFAFDPKASENNERFYVGIKTAQGRTTLVQIAGIMARRIAFYEKKGNILARGQRYGMIKLGSKVDVYLPPNVESAVKVGDRVKAGESALGVVRA